MINKTEITTVHVMRGLIVSISFYQGFLRTSVQGCGAFCSTLLHICILRFARGTVRARREVMKEMSYYERLQNCRFELSTFPTKDRKREDVENTASHYGLGVKWLDRIILENQ